MRAALALIDEEGLGAFSMRTLGSRLGVQAMSLYRHLPGREAILDGVVRLLLAEVDVPREGSWHELLGGWARAHRAVARAHPRAFPLLSDRPVVGYASARDDAEGALRLMVEAGFTPDDAGHAIRTLARYVVGFSITAPPDGRPPDGAAEGLAAEGYPLLGRLVARTTPQGEDDLFEFGLALMLEGLRARVEEPPGGGGPRRSAADE